jgi:putative transposase
MMLSKRKQIHLTNYDYSGSDAAYFITLCTQGKQAYFRKPQVAQYIADEINYRARTTEEVLVFAYYIMPDHLHLLLKLNDGYGKTLQNWVAAFKRYTARLLNQLENITPLWQKNFYEHVVRMDESLKGIAEYIVHNPIRKIWSAIGRNIVFCRLIMMHSNNLVVRRVWETRFTFSGRNPECRG